MDEDPKWKGVLPLTAGILALVALVGGLGLWAVRAELSGAVVAPGQVKVETNRQAVQHPEGGVVGDLLVKDSDRVDEGDILIQLDGRRPKSELSIVDLAQGDTSALETIMTQCADEALGIGATTNNEADI